MFEYKQIKTDLEKKAQAFVSERGLDTKNLHLTHEFYNFKAVKSSEGEDFDGLKIEGYLSTFKNVDRENDVIQEGAFDNAIKEIKKRGGTLPMLRDHYNDTSCQIGHWKSIKVDENGVYAEGYISRTEKTAHLIKLIEDGAINTLSIGGMARYAEKSNRSGNNIIEEFYLLEASVVSIPANPMAQFSTKSLFFTEKAEGVGGSKPTQVSSRDRVISILKASNL